MKKSGVNESLARDKLESDLEKEMGIIHIEMKLHRRNRKQMTWRSGIKSEQQSMKYRT